MEADLRETVEKQAFKPLTFLLTHSDSDYTVACGEFEEILVHPAEMARLAAIKEKTGHYSLVMHDSSGVDNETLRD